VLDLYKMTKRCPSPRVRNLIIARAYYQNFPRRVSKSQPVVLYIGGNESAILSREPYQIFVSKGDPVISDGNVRSRLARNLANDGRDLTRMPLERLSLLARLSIPQLDRLITRARGHRLAVRGERYRQDLIRMPLERLSLLTRLSIL
jgi:hypothetical protein